MSAAVAPKRFEMPRSCSSGAAASCGVVALPTSSAAAAAGVDCFVAGSAVYSAEDPDAVVRALAAQAKAIRAD